MYKNNSIIYPFIGSLICGILFLASCSNQEKLQAAQTAQKDSIPSSTGKLTVNQTFNVKDTAAANQVLLVISSIYTGTYATEMRAELAQKGQEATERIFNDDVNTYYSYAKTAEPIKFEDHTKANTLKVTESYTISNADFWAMEDKKPYKHFRYFTASLIQEHIRNFELEDRTAALTLRYPANVEQNISINLPFATMVPNTFVKHETAYMYFEFASRYKGNHIELHYAYHSLKDHLEKNELTGYLVAAKKIDALLGYKVMQQ